jgi:hypothetical protein
MTTIITTITSWRQAEETTRQKEKAWAKVSGTQQDTDKQNQLLEGGKKKIRNVSVSVFLA